MVELRWIKRRAERRDGPIFYGDDVAQPKEAWVRVLQYRRATGLYWSPWMDVEEVDTHSCINNDSKG